MGQRGQSVTSALNVGIRSTIHLDNRSTPDNFGLAPLPRARFFTAFLHAVTGAAECSGGQGADCCPDTEWRAAER